MDDALSQAIADAAAQARRRAAAYKPPVDKDALPWRVIEAFDDRVRGAVERDRRIEDERDRVLVAAVKLAETPTDEEDQIEEARAHLTGAIDYLEQAVLRFGIPSRRKADRGT